MESKLSANMRKYAVAQGCAFYKLDDISRGMPDRLLLAPNGAVAFFEIKTTTGRLRKIQKYFINKLITKFKQNVYVVNDLEEFKKIVDDIVGM